MNEIRNKFPFFKNNPNTVYLDSAASSLKLQSVIDAIISYYANNGTNVYRGVYSLSNQATNDFEKTRKLVARLINSKEEEVIFTKGTTDGLNKLNTALNSYINAGDEVITSELEHHSSLMPWQYLTSKKKAKLVYIPLNDNGMITLDGFKQVMNENTKVVALTHISNALGFITPLKDLVSYARKINPKVIFIVDGAQSIPHIKVDVKDLDIDFFAFSAHKMYGPSGVGVLYGKAELLKQLPPFDLGGEMAEIVTKDSYSYKEAPYKFEAGTPNIAGVIGFSKALEFYLENDLDAFYKYEMSLRDYTLKALREIKELEIYNDNAAAAVITFNVKGMHPHDIASVLDQKGIAVRAGHHCAQLVTKRIAQIATLRVSFGIYNTFEEIGKFIVALKETVKFFEGFGI